MERTQSVTREVNRMLLQSQAVMNFEEADYSHVLELATCAMKLANTTQKRFAYFKAQQFRAHALRGLQQWREAYSIYQEIENYIGPMAELERVMGICLEELAFERN